MNGSNEERLELLFELLRRPIPWDPIPEWLRLDEDMIRQFAAMEIQFQIREAQLQQEKLQTFAKMMRIG